MPPITHPALELSNIEIQIAHEIRALVSQINNNGEHKTPELIAQELRQYISSQLKDYLGAA